jgi:hypothetical protein
MKKLLLFPVLLISCINLYGQSIKFGDLVYFTSLGNREVFDNLIRGNAFRQNYTMEVDGQEIESFKSIGARANIEKIDVGKYSKLNDGTVLRTVNYSSFNQHDIINMISQVKRYGLELKFQGADSTNNIYLYDSNFYKVSIFLRRDQTSGTIEVKQKEYLGLD